MSMKLSEAFEGPNSPLRKAFDEATDQNYLDTSCPECNQKHTGQCVGWETLTPERSIEEIKKLRPRLLPTKAEMDTYEKRVIELFTQTLTTERQKREEQGKRFVTLMNQALGQTELPESVWKKIAKVNQLILDK